MIARSPIAVTAALALAVQATPAPSNVADGDAVEAFVQVCLQGSGRFARGAVEEIDRPPFGNLRDYLVPKATNHYYRFRSTRGEAYLAIQDTEASGGAKSARHCSVVAPGLDLAETARRILPGRMTEFRRGRYVSVSMEGYLVHVVRVGGGHVGMTSIHPGENEVRTRQAGMEADAVSGRAILDAFRLACARINDADLAVADARAAAWEPLTPEEEARVDRLDHIVRADEGRDQTGTRLTFRRRVADQQLILIVSGADCRIYDFAATQPFTRGLLDQWMGRPPTGVENARLSRRRLLWSPGWRDDISVEIHHLSPYRPIRHGLSGNIMVARAIGGF